MFSVLKEMTNSSGLSWKKSELRGAEFEISHEYNGTCIANVRLTNTSYAPPRPLSGRNLAVDTNITQSFANERGDVCAVAVEIVYQFTYAHGSAGTFTQRFVLFGVNLRLIPIWSDSGHVHAERLLPTRWHSGSGRAAYQGCRDTAQLAPTRSLPNVRQHTACGPSSAFAYADIRMARRVRPAHAGRILCR
jgi:hypothetical protein